MGVKLFASSEGLPIIVGPLVLISTTVVARIKLRALGDILKVESFILPPFLNTSSVSKYKYFKKLHYKLHTMYIDIFQSVGLFSLFHM